MISKKARLRKRKTAAHVIKRRGTSRARVSESRTMNPRGNYAPRATHRVRGNPPADKTGTVIKLKSGREYRIGECGEWLRQ